MRALLLSLFGLTALTLLLFTGARWMHQFDETTSPSSFIQSIDMMMQQNDQKNAPEPIRGSVNTNTVLSDASSSSGATKRESRGGYYQYATGILGGGEPIRLFFFHSSCGTLCARIDAHFKNLYRTNPPALSTYRVNMDTYQSLADRFSATGGTILHLSSSGAFIRTEELIIRE